MFNLAHDRSWKHELSIALGHGAENKEGCNLETADSHWKMQWCVIFISAYLPEGHYHSNPR